MRRRPREPPFFPVGEWFERLFGFEESFENIDRYINFLTSDEGICIHSLKANRVFTCGTFEMKNLSSYHNLPLKPNLGTFSIINGLGDGLVSHSIPDFNGSTFQVDSHFNCLDFVSPDQTAEDGLTSYAYSITNGSQCDLATAPSLFQRNYYITTQNNEEINLLSLVPIPIKHGFPLFGRSNFVHSVDFDWSNLDNYFIGSHQNCQVVFKRYDKENLMFIQQEQQKQFVHHVYASSLDFSNGDFNNDTMRTIEKFLLEAEYKATIYAAWENSLKYNNFPGANKCFLTVLGFGQFSAPIGIVFDAIRACKDAILQSGLEVALLANNKDVFLKSSNELKELVSQTNGQVIP